MTGRLRHLRRRHDESGVVAIVAALCAVVLFGTAAMAVDLGNAWARKRASQTQADLAALAAGIMLPKGDAAHQAAIAAEVAAYFNRNSPDGTAPVTGAQLLDGGVANGEISFPTEKRLRVVTPPSLVPFGLAGAVGMDHTDVQTSATVELRAGLPDIEDVLPMWLPATCVYGPIAGDTGPHELPSASPTYSPTSVDSKLHVVAISTAAVDFGESVTDLQVTLANSDNTPVSGMGAIAFTFGPPTSWATADTVYPVTLAIPGRQGPADGTQVVTIPSVGIEVSDTVGVWQVWAVRGLVSGKVVQPTSRFSDTGSPGPAKFTVHGGGGEVACDDHQRGNFGQLDSPRNGVFQNQRAYAYNLALGLDHTLAPFPEPVLVSGDAECTADGVPMGALIDNAPSEDQRNCIYVQSGNDAPYLTAGLLSGVSGGPEGWVPGRLYSAPTSPRCVANGRLAPRKTDDARWPWEDINRDTLSCFLKDGYTLADIARDGADFDALDASVMDSPRFFWVPIVYSLDRSDKKYVAIKSFAPAFITDETTTTAATSGNGIEMNTGGTQLFGVQIFAFNANALPLKGNAETVEWTDGARGVTRLVD